MEIDDFEVIKILALMYPHDYPEPETIALLLKEKLRVTEIPVEMNMRTTGSSSISFLPLLTVGSDRDPCDLR